MEGGSLTRVRIPAINPLNHCGSGMRCHECQNARQKIHTSRSRRIFIVNTAPLSLIVLLILGRSLARLRKCCVVRDDDEAVTLADNSHYEPGGAVFSKDAEPSRRMASRIATGMVYIN